MDGRGVETWEDGRKYEGEFKNGRKEGSGTFEWPNGNKYIGSWMNDKQHGVGVFINMKEKSKRQGEWKGGKRIRWISSIEHIAGSPTK
jgi:hypothetical protein